ncbi:hypothetical protein [Arthrobacter sp. efr-133-TYG-104]|uniref:hypothetical protein n=1 Tax=Arthrobacter sp. efr-133-TYG-104 TaxID=3040324 RepID=UPI00254CC813|nr:hypothetical protein [Arthrobacter sp. efr-133-TYG-104]
MAEHPQTHEVLEVFAQDLIHDSIDGGAAGCGQKPVSTWLFSPVVEVWRRWIVLDGDRVFARDRERLGCGDDSSDGCQDGANAVKCGDGVYRTVYRIGKKTVFIPADCEFGQLSASDRCRWAVDD